jgi:Zn-dependent protease with chaperone function
VLILLNLYVPLRAFDSQETVTVPVTPDLRGTLGTIPAFQASARGRREEIMLRLRRNRAGAVVLALLLSAHGLSAQTVITPPKNKYTPAQDVELGQKAAQEVEKEMPIMNNAEVTRYLEQIGNRLVGAIPQDLQHPEFQYSFRAVNVREINAFALPGGPMFVNRGMMQAAKTEGEIAGVMAHELSHVALRHGTAQATKATPYELGALAGAVIGAIIGGRTGNVVAQGTRFGLGTAFLRYGREYEKQADLLGAQIMARAGYDPRDMANMFRTIEAQGGSGGPEWMSDHPNPGNRVEYITAEAEQLQVQNPVRDTRQFQQVQAQLNSMPKAPTTQEAARGNAGGTVGTSGRSGRVGSVQVQRPSSSFRTYNEGNVFRISVPSNWQELSGNDSVTFAPEGAYGNTGNQNVFTHGLQVGVARIQTNDLQRATDGLLDSLAQSNPNLRRKGGYSRTTIDGQDGIRATLSNQSDVTGREERIALFTTLMQDGNLFYAIGVAPSDEFSTYNNAFQQSIRSLQLAR